MVERKISPRRRTARSGKLANKKTATDPATRVLVGGKPMVLLEEGDYERLLDKADQFEPLRPEPSDDGTLPALEAIRAGLAERLVRHRRKAGLSQAELARRAGIRPALLSRIEHAKIDPGVATIEKLDKVLCGIVDE